MKVIISETQRKKLVEQSLLSYTPEKIDQLVIDGKRIVEKLKPLPQTYYNRLLHIQFSQIFENLSEFESAMKEIKTYEEKCEQIGEKYYNIAETFDYMDLPPNVKEIEKIYYILQETQDKLRSIYDVYEAAYDSIDHFIKWDLKSFDNTDIKNI